MAKHSKQKRARHPRRIELTQDEAHEFLRVVRDDLELLRALDFAKPSRAAVRVASSILRRLFHEGMYADGWRIAGFDGQPSFTAVDLQAAVARVEPRYIHYAYAGGAKTLGAQHSGYMLLVIPKVEAEAEGHEVVAKRVTSTFQPGPRRAFPFNEFCSSPVVISGTASVSRLACIRYVANKLGGVHWDNERGAWTDPISSRHRLLDEGHLIVGRLPAPLYEIVSIAQAVATSEDTTLFIAKVGEIAPESELAANVLRFREGRTGKYADMTFNSNDAPPTQQAKESNPSLEATANGVPPSAAPQVER